MASVTDDGVALGTNKGENGSFCHHLQEPMLEEVQTQQRCYSSKEKEEEEEEEEEERGTKQH